MPMDREFVPEAFAFVPIAKAESSNALAPCPRAPEFVPCVTWLSPALPLETPCTASASARSG